MDDRHAAAARIVVAGDALVDLLLASDGRLVPVPGGGSYNVTRAIGRLGVAVSFLGCLSTDAFGRSMAAALEADGVDTSLVRRTDRPTTLALAEVDEHGAASYRFYAEGTSTPDLPPGDVPPLPPGIVAAEVGSLGLVLEPLAATLLDWALALPGDVLLLVDPNCRPGVIPDAGAYRARMARLFARADVVKASTEDLAFLAPGTEPLDAARGIVARGPRAVLVTDGARSVSVLAGGAEHPLAVPPTAVVDTVGAGDTFGGAFLGHLVTSGVRRADLPAADALLRAAAFAVRAAGAVCGRAGADPPRLAELGGWGEG